ncbi:YciI family protein [Tropicimonas sp. TH_r6]|uniref:YciI family protein n=1 Tax=Tropicimonas sp. TH_r6 TaxID=3082085 RepID=UPI0029538BFC|nr:YciI family protein [Tropicimonas sp. TH_r6]MDV7141455.1 YciI family protein [Tropicimonas sp. TH_r6]
MPAWSEYKQEARERGALALELYVVRTRPAKPPEALREMLPTHLAYQAELEAAGKLAFAGPVSDESGENLLGEGMIIYRADSLDEARALAEADPMHKSGTRSFDLRRWLINEGSFTLTVGLSGQQVGFR